MKILAIDIETRPAVVYTWGLWQVNIGVDQIIDPGGMICFASKWIGERGVEFKSDFHDSHEEMIQRVWELLDEADAVVHYNGTKFDVPHIQREFMELGMTPPSPYKQIDLWKVVKRHGRFVSNKLAHVAPRLGVGHKVENGGFLLWKQCLEGDEKAWAKMKKYNMQDTKLLEETYEILRPWVPSHPSHAALKGERICPKCGGNNIEFRGSYTLTSGKYPKIVCKGCGSWSRLNKRTDSTDIVQLTL